jgi:hypothetical protein
MDPGGPVGCGYSDENRCANPVRESGGESYCDSEGRKCKTVRVECLAPDGRTHCFIKSETQCGAPGSCGTTETPPPQASLACTGITSTPAVTTPPVIGGIVTFTCAGTITPAAAGTLSYKFRYSIDGGAPVALANKTPTTAELTIAACGSYSVQCQTCATVLGVLRCDPNWTGATQ